MDPVASSDRASGSWSGEMTLHCRLGAGDDSCVRGVGGRIGDSNHSSEEESILTTTLFNSLNAFRRRSIKLARRLWMGSGDEYNSLASGSFNQVRRARAQFRSELTTTPDSYHINPDGGPNVNSTWTLDQVR